MLGCAGLSGQEPASLPSDPLADFQAKYEQAKQETLQPIEQLRAGYLANLDKQLEAAKKQGELDRVRWILAETEWLGGGGKQPTDPGFPESAKIRSVYFTSLKERETQRIDRLATIIERAGPLLATMEKDFTRDGRIERAVAAREFATAIRAELEELRKKSEKPVVAGLKEGEKVIWSVGSSSDFRTVEGCEAKESGGSWTLTSPPDQRGHIESKELFTPPFRIAALAATESGDLRFFFGPSTSMEFVLFNWTRNPTVLRLADPAGQAGIGSFPDRGMLDIGRTYLIEVVVEKRKIEVYVDGELRGNLVVDLDKMREPVGIGPFGTETFPARMIFEQFCVIVPKE